MTTAGASGAGSLEPLTSARGGDPGAEPRDVARAVHPAAEPELPHEAPAVPIGLLRRDAGRPRQPLACAARPRASHYALARLELAREFSTLVEARSASAADHNQQPSPGARRTPGCRWKATPSAMTPCDSRDTRSSWFPDKPDWPPSAATAVSRRRALSAGSCRCSTGRGNGRSRRTHDLLQACRMTSVRTNEHWPANRAFSLQPPMIGGARVRNQSDRMQRNKATATTKKTCKCRPSRERLKGFEPSNFCMASRTCGSWSACLFPAKGGVLGCENRPAIPRLLPGVHGGLGTSGHPAALRVWSLL